MFWTDIEGCELLALVEENGLVKLWSLPERLGTFALTEKLDALLLGLTSRLGFFDLNTKRSRLLYPQQLYPATSGKY